MVPALSRFDLKFLKLDGLNKFWKFRPMNVRYPKNPIKNGLNPIITIYPDIADRTLNQWSGAQVKEMEKRPRRRGIHDPKSFF